MKSQRYYEAHVTIDPVEGEERMSFETCCRCHGFRPADLLMTKSAGKLEPWDGDAFCTARHEDYVTIVNMTRYLVERLMDCGFKVRRFKIEDTLLDSRLGDGLPGMMRNLNSEKAYSK
jgi:hypothetical protein